MGKRETGNAESLEALQAQIAELQKKADEILRAEKAAAVATIKELVKKYGITAKEVGLHAGVESAARPPKEKTDRKPPEAKYRNAEGETWSGRGVPPAWIKAAQAEGRSLDDFLIKPE